MNKDQQKKALDLFTGKMKETLLSKGDDYANTDRLSNFKQSGSICGITAQQSCLTLIATKVSRLGVLLGNGNSKPNNEPVEDSILDLANHAALLWMLVHEQKQEVSEASCKVDPVIPEPIGLICVVVSPTQDAFIDFIRDKVIHINHVKGLFVPASESLPFAYQSKDNKLIFLCVTTPKEASQACGLMLNALHSQGTAKYLHYERFEIRIHPWTIISNEDEINETLNKVVFNGLSDLTSELIERYTLKAR